MCYLLRYHFKGELQEEVVANMVEARNKTVHDRSPLKSRKTSLDLLSSQISFKGELEEVVVANMVEARFPFNTKTFDSN